MILKNIDILIFVALALVPLLALIVLRFFRRDRESPLSQLAFAGNETAGDTIPEDPDRPLRVRPYRVRRDSIAIVLYEALLIVVIALFYLNPDVEEWRIRRELIRSGITQPIGIQMAHGNAILTGNISTRRVAIKVSQRVMEVVGPGHVTNRLRVETPEILGGDSEALGAAEVSIDTAYDDSPQSLQEIGAILSLPQFETIQVTRGSTLQGLIAKRYGIVRSKLPGSFAALTAAIKRLNELSGAMKLHPGILKIPVLPARYGALHPHAVRRAQAQQPGFVDLVTSGLSGTLQRVGISKSFRPIGSSRVVLEIPFTRGTAEQTQRVREVLPFSLLRSMMRIEFGSGGSGGGLHKALTNEDRGAILKALKKQKQRDATIFILDAGWPDEMAYRSSLAELRRLVDRARDFYKLDAVQWETPMTHDEFSKTEPPQHCVEIQRSLQEFTGLDQDHVVKVVYVPLSRKQKSDQILNEMLQLYKIRSIAATRNNLTPEEKKVLSKQAMDFATRVLNQLNPTTPDIPDAPGWGQPEYAYQQTWETDSSIVAAVWYLAELESYRNATNPVYFLNESWTVLKDRIHFEAPEKSFGIVVAAVGNAPGMEVNGERGEIEFARLSSPANNVLAALDAKAGADEPDCNSAQIVEADLDGTMAAGFDGNVTDGNVGVCGSSFSAPRIAWILALAEAVRTDSPDVRHWAGSVQQRLVATREPGSSHQWKKLYLHPNKILP